MGHVETTKVDAWMPMYWGDYFSNTRDFSAVEHGAYICLIGFYWQTGGPLQNDQKTLLRIAGLSGRGAAGTLCRVLSKFQLDGNTLRHKRIDEELEKARERKAKYAERAEKGASARWSKARTKDASSIAQAMHTDASSPSPSPDLTRIVEIDRIVEITRAESPKKRAPEKREYSPGVFLTEDEHARLVADFGADELGYWLESCSGYAKDKPSKWRSHKDHNRTIRNWRRLREEEGKSWDASRKLYMRSPAPRGYVNGKQTPQQIQDANFALAARIRAEEGL